MNRAQLRALLWLRLRLTRNQWARSKGLGQALAALLTALVVVLSLGSFAAGALGGYFGLGVASPFVVGMVWAALGLGFAFWWLIGLLSELQRSELIDIPRLMHLPVRLGQLYVVNYLASHVGLSVPMFALGAAGLALGSALARGPALLLPLLTFLTLMFATTAWTYCFQGWIATQVTNPRRRRMLVMGLTLVIVLGAQVPNLAVNVFQVGMPKHHHGHAAQVHAAASSDAVEPELELTTELVPPLWPGAAAAHAARKSPLFALLSTLALLGFGALGLRRGYLGTLRFYQGSPSAWASSAAPRPQQPARDVAPVRGRRLVERALPGVHPQTSAVALATLRSMLRAPEAMIMVGVTMMVSLIVGAGLVVRVRGHLPAELAPVATTAAMGFSLFILTQFLINQFGFDRDGMRALILSPVPRARVLLGKNLAVAAVAALPSGILLVSAAVALRLSALEALAGALQWLALLVLAILIGGLVSILAPYRINPGSMKAANLPPSSVLAIVLCQTSFPAVLSPVAAGPLAVVLFHALHWSYGGLADLAVSAVLAALVTGLYRACLPPLGRLLQRRETVILAKVTVDHE